MTTINPDSSLPPPDNSPFPAATADATTSGLRISDVLALSQDDDEEPEEKSSETHPRRDLRSLLMSEEGFFEDRRRSTHCASPPCRLVSRWVSWIRRVKIKGISRKCGRRERVNGVEADVQPRCLTNGLNDVGYRNETCFNAGIGAYLLYLVAATRNELDRINAARVEMETILRNTKQLQRRRSIERDGDDGVLLEFSIRKSVVVDDEEEEEEDHDDEDECEPQFPANLYALPAAASSSSSSSTLVSGSETPKREEILEDMEQLEAELEAELEFLQLQLDGDKLTEHSQLQRGVRNGEETESSKTYSMISSEDEEEEEEEEEVIDPEHGQADEDCLGGVSPYELERRLHEVLESRQQEEIRELEAALASMKRKLQEKELQVSWWKAVARGRRFSISSSQEVQS